MLFHLNVGHAFDIFDCGFNRFCISTNGIQVVAVQFDTHLRLDTRNHMRNQVSQWLFDADDDPWHVFQTLSNVVKYFLTRPTGIIH